MTDMPIRHDLSATRQPFPFPLPTTTPLDSLGALGERLLRRNLPPYGSQTGALSADYLWTPTPGIHAAHEAIVRWRSASGIVRLVPDDDALAAYDGVAEDVGLLNGFRIPVDALLEHDRRKTLVLSTPNGISGRIASVQEIVRLVRHFALVVMDERLAAFSLRRLTPLVMEWENLISMQHCPFLMPGQTQDFGWVIHPRTLAAFVREHMEPLPEATIDDALRYGGIDTFRAERHIGRRKSQLYRELRKMSIVSVPYPSWSNALLARVERGNRDEIVQGLEQRGILAYAPTQDNLRQHLRTTAVSDAATLALRQALIDINRDL